MLVEAEKIVIENWFTVLLIIALISDTVRDIMKFVCIAILAIVLLGRLLS